MYLYCLLDAVMQEQVAIGQLFWIELILNLTLQVIIPMDDDVTVLNRPVETKYYSPPPDHIHSEVKLNQLVLIIHFYLWAINPTKFWSHTEVLL